MTFFIIYTTAIVLCWSIGTTTSAQLGKAQPTPPTLLTSPATVNVTVGTEVVVICSEPGGTVQWYGPDGGVVPSSGDVRQAGPSSARQLVFTSYQSSQGGQYQCRTSKDGTNSTLYVTLGTKVEGVTVTRTVQGSSPALRVSWTAINGSGITYTVCYSTTSGAQSDPPSGANCGASGITGTSTTLSPLSIGTTYYIWVAAVSSGGRGAYSDKQQARTYNVPLKVSPRPTLTKAARSGRPALTVTWTAPQSDRPITKYQVHYRRSGTTSWSTKEVTSRSTTLENLPAGTIYQVRMRAVSDVGVGPYSDVGAIITYRVPSKVGHLTLTKAARSGRPALTLTWTAPQSDRPITKYQVQYRSSGATSWSAKDVTSRSTTLENLPAGTGYQAQVRAVSDVGTGPYSDVRTITTYRVPSRVSGVTVTKAVRSGRPALIVRWTRHNVNERVTGYQVQYRRGTSGEWREKRVSSVSTSTYLENLDIGTSYQVRVNALSDIANGPVGDIRVQTTYNDPPPPSGVRVTPLPQHGVLRVTWRAPTVDTGLTITGYSVQYRTSSTGPYSRARTVSGTSTSTTISGLQLGTRYRVRVAAVTQLGTGVYSSDVVGTTYKPPPAPSDVRVTPLPQRGVLRVTWRAPTVDTGLTITGYSVQYRTSSTGPYSRAGTVSGISTSTTISGLQLGTGYRVRVAAVTQLGTGVYSSDVGGTTYNVPYTVNRNSITVSQTTYLQRAALSVQWRPPSNGGATIQQYTVMYRKKTGGSPTTKTTNTPSYQLVYLDIGSVYILTIRARSGIGTSSPITIEGFTYQVSPPRSVYSVPIAKRGTLHISWTPPANLYSLQVTGYVIQYKETTSRQYRSTRNTPSSSPYELTGLSVGRSYHVRIAVRTTSGVGNYSTPVEGRTFNVPSKVSPHPTLTKAARSGRPALTVTWTAPQSDRPITIYQVQYRRSSTTSWSTKDVTSRSTTLENLIVGTGYQVQVRAVSDVGAGPYSDMETLSTFRVSPPRSVSSVPIAKRGTLRISWTPPANLYSLQVTGYVIQYKETTSRQYTSTSNTPSTSPYELTGLSVGRSYHVRIAVRTTSGDGNYSTPVEGRTYDVPHQVTGVQPKDVQYNSNLSLIITWNRPSSEASILYYEVQYWENRRLQPTVKAYGEQITLNGTVGRIYIVRVRAVSTVGGGPWSESDGPPQKPSNIIISNYTSSLTVHWDEERETKYMMYVQKKASMETIAFEDVTTPYNITGLESNTEYTVIIEAYNSVGSANGSTMGCTLPEVLRNLILQVISSTSIRVTWTTPPNAERLPLTYHVGYFSEFTVRMSTSTTELSLVLTSLHPFDEYTVTVEAENNGGRGGPVVRQATTLSAVPVFAPVVTSPVEPRSRSAPLQWSLPPKKGRNGIITGYIVELWVYVTEDREFRSVRNITVPNDRPPDITYLVTGLTPYTRYAWKVAAVNDAGVGVLTSSSVFKTLDDVPGPVSNLSYNITSNTSAVIMWSEPEEPNGVITGYDVVYGVYEEDNSTTLVHVKELILTVGNLIPEKPIEVSVSARTKIGKGKNTSKIFFTSEGAPTVKVRNVVTKWINDNSAVHVSWTPLTLHEARGFPLYVVTYWPSSLNRVSRDINSITTTDSRVVIGGLDPTTSYSITVDVYTGNGTIKGSVTAEMNIVNPPVKRGIDNMGVIAGSLVSFLVVIVLILVITITTVVYLTRKHKIRMNAETKEDNTKNECVQLEDNPAYGEVNIYEEIQ